MSAFTSGISGMQANNLWLDQIGGNLASSSVSFQAPQSFEAELGNATITGLDPTGTLTPGLGGFTADSLAAFDMGIGSDILDLMLAQHGFQVNARVVDSASQTSQIISALG